MLEFLMQHKDSCKSKCNYLL